MDTLGVVVPCHNEAQSLPILLPRLLSTIQKTKFKNFKVLLVDDGSTDNTWEVIKRHTTDKVLGVKFTRNFGHQSAINFGLNELNCDAYLIIDADLQDPPELLVEFEIILLNNPEVEIVYGVRKERKGETFFKKFTAKLFYKLLAKLSEIKIPMDTGDFRLITRRVRNFYIELNESVRFARGLFAWSGFESVGVPYVRESSEKLKTSYTFKKMIEFGLNGISGFSVVPLRIPLFLGVLGLIFSTLILSYTLISYILYDLEPGWMSSIFVASFFGSINLLSLGFISEYLRISYIELKKRPDYIWSKKTYGDKNGR
jgi:glycosyltransferase involved in cell wall biosynthesis